MNKLSPKIKNVFIEFTPKKHFFIFTFFILFIIIALLILLIFPLTKNYIENETYNKVEYYKEDLKDQINIMLKYKKDITVGEFIGRYSPDLSKDIKKDKALISKLMYDDDYSDFVRD